MDHIIPVSIADHLKFDTDNFQTLCEDYNGASNCHSQKTALQRNITTIEDYVNEMDGGKLMYICTEDKRDRLIRKMRGN